MTGTADTHDKCAERIHMVRDEHRRGEEAIWSEINSVRHTLYGNGEHGLNTRIAVMGTKLDALAESERARRLREWAVVGSILMLVLKDFLVH